MSLLLDKIVARAELPQVAQAVIHAIDASEAQEFCIGVSGDLGTGKTTLLQEFLLALSEKDAALKSTSAETKGQSPTYVYLKVYEGATYSVWHVDAYRLAQKIWQEIFATWQEDDSPRKHILWVEWYDRLDAKPPDISIKMDFVAQPDSRHFQVQILR